MIKSYQQIGLVVGALIGIMCCQALAEETDRFIVDGVGAVLEVGTGDQKPIYVIDEHHNSVKVQIEQAVMLNRLYDAREMRDIALEAYLFSDTKLDVEWYQNASDNDFGSRARVAARLLGEGEISSAEFMALVYDDVLVHPTEVAEEYHVAAPKRSVGTIENYLFLMAEHQGARLLRSAAKPMTEANAAYRSLRDSGAADDELRQAADLFRDERDKLFRKMVSIDPWLLEHYEFFSKPMKSLDEWLDRSRVIQERAKSQSIIIKTELLEEMNSFIKFYGGRAKASFTMANAALSVAEAASGGSVSLIIGAGHTQDVVRVLRDRNQRYLSIRSNTTYDPETFVPDIKFEYWKERADGRSLYSKGFMSIINELVGDKKNPPTINAPWLQMKAELYLIVDKMTEAVLAQGKGENGGLSPGLAGGVKPPSFPPPDSARRWVGFDPSRVTIVTDDVAERNYFHLSAVALNRLRKRKLPSDILQQLERQLGAVTIKEERAMQWGGESVSAEVKGVIAAETRVDGVPTVLFPVVLNFQDEDNRRELWVKAGRIRSTVSGQEREDVEKLLMNELQRALSSEGVSSPKLEDEGGRVQVSADTVMAIGSDLSSVRDRSVTSI